jgi:hypothetical protein
VALSRRRFGGESAPLAGVRRSLMKHVTVIIQAHLMMVDLNSGDNVHAL